MNKLTQYQQSLMDEYSANVAYQNALNSSEYSTDMLTVLKLKMLQKRGIADEWRWKLDLTLEDLITEIQVYKKQIALLSTGGLQDPYAGQRLEQVRHLLQCASAAIQKLRQIREWEPTGIC